ncbi:MAG: hypothetical protein FWE67_07475 [Planctomycetaceae bacterium]|nr:hypothetical protein [Planctomycetaceae bacterium]
MLTPEIDHFPVLRQVPEKGLSFFGKPFDEDGIIFEYKDGMDSAAQ